MNDARTPPHNPAAEKSALGSVFISASALAELSELTTDDFFLPAHREIFDAMRAVAKRGRGVDVIAVADELKTSDMLARLPGGQSYLNELANDVPMAANVRHYVRLVSEKATLRRLIAACAEIQSSAYGDFGELPEFMSEVRRKFSVIDAGARLGTLTPFRDIADALMDEIEKREKRFRETGDTVSGIARFGIGSLDTAMSGIQIGDLGIIAAETSGGKTALAMQAIYWAVLSGGTGMAINLEMPKLQLAERALAHAARINSYLLRTGQTTVDMWTDIRATVDKLCASKLYLEDDATTLPQISAKARQWRALNREESAVLVVDFAQLIRGASEKGMSRAQQVGIYGQELKALSKELRCGTILVSQITREGVKKSTRPTMFDLKESGDLENAADWIVIIHNTCAEPTGDDPVDFHLDKLRNGQKAKREGWWTGRHYLFTDNQPEHRETRFADAD